MTIESKTDMGYQPQKIPDDERYSLPFRMAGKRPEMPFPGILAGF